MRYSTRLIILIGAIAMFFVIIMADVTIRKHFHSQNLRGRIQLQKIVPLPNLGITTAARYLRHHALTDLSTPFQDFPVSQEHFPASFAYAPPDFTNMPAPLTVESERAIKQNDLKAE